MTYYILTLYLGKCENSIKLKKLTKKLYLYKGMDNHYILFTSYLVLLILNEYQLNMKKKKEIKINLSRNVLCGSAAVGQRDYGNGVYSGLLGSIFMFKISGIKSQRWYPPSNYFQNKFPVCECWLSLVIRVRVSEFIQKI